MSKSVNLYDQLKEFIDDYVNYMEKINKRRLEAAEKEADRVKKELVAFNILRQNIFNLQREYEFGISEN